MENVVQILKIEAMSTISARVDQETKRKMERHKKINWSKEIREFVQNRIRQEERRKHIRQISERISKKLPKGEPGFSEKSVREDRDR